MPDQTSETMSDMADPMTQADVPDNLVRAALGAVCVHCSLTVGHRPLSSHEAEARAALAAVLPIHERQVRAAVAADIRDHPGPNPSPANPAWWAGYVEAQSDCARIADGAGRADDDA